MARPAASKGIRLRLGRKVRDAYASEVIRMPLTSKDVADAQRKRQAYDVDDPQNFSECVLATCASKITGAEVLVFRRYAYVALPDKEETLRYQLSKECVELVRLNDLKQWKNIPANSYLDFQPPSRGRKLQALRDGTSSHVSTGTKSASDPYQGVYRNGVHA